MNGKGKATEGKERKGTGWAWMRLGVGRGVQEAVTDPTGRDRSHEPRQVPTGRDRYQRAATGTSAPPPVTRFLEIINKRTVTIIVVILMCYQ